jgi:hypothetical protein
MAFKITTNLKSGQLQGKMYSKLAGNIWYFSAYFLLILVTYLSLVPDLGQYFPKTIINLLGNGDKAHFFCYLVLMYCFSRAYSHQIDPKNIGLTLIIIGVSIEFFQEFLGPERGFSSTDILGNFLGVLLGFFLFNINKIFFSLLNKNA